MGWFSKKPERISKEEMQRRISGIGLYGRGEENKLQTYISGLLKDLESFDLKEKNEYISRIKETLISAGHKPELYIKD